MRKSLSTKNEFAKLYLAGEYTQTEIIKKVGISHPTAKAWVNELFQIQCFKMRKELLKSLSTMMKPNNYTENVEKINVLISNIERLTKLMKN